MKLLHFVDAADYFRQMRTALKAELEFEKLKYAEALKSFNIKNLVKEGLAWYPLSIKEQGFGMGEYPYLVIEHRGQIAESQQMRGGAQVVFFSQSPNDVERSVQATMIYVQAQTAKISLHADDFPDWLGDGKLGIMVQPDETGYKEMFKAMELIEQSHNKEQASIRDTILGIKAPEQVDIRPLNVAALNPSQNLAAGAMQSAQLVSIIHGPPGTGKTTTIVEGIAAMPEHMFPILLCAPSNAAADLLAEQLHKRKIKVLRIGNLGKISPDLEALTPEGALRKSPAYQSIKGLKKQADEFRRMANKYKRNFGKDERMQRNLLLKESRDLVNQARKWEDDIMVQMVAQAQAIVTTPVYANHKWLQGLQFECCIIDEAAQGLAPLCWIPVLRAKKVVLAGDPFQLPPTVKSDEARRLGLETTLLELAMQNIPQALLLDIQYRMHEAINAFSNAWFYQDKVQTPVSNHSPFELPVEFIDTAGCGFEEKLLPETQSYVNEEEAMLLIQHLQATRAAHPELSAREVGIITPYKSQALHISTATGHQYTVDTVDAFQGRERSVIYISLVRSNSTGEIGFLKEYRRMNVALTRAKYKLVVIGDSSTLGADDFYNAFLQFCQDRGYYRSAWEWIS